MSVKSVEVTTLLALTSSIMITPTAIFGLTKKSLIMCLAIPMKLTEIEGTSGIVSIDGIVRKVNLALVPNAKVGSYLIIHAGYAIEILNEYEANITLDAIRKL